MFDLISHLTEKGIQHTVSDNGHITVGDGLDLSGTSITALPENVCCRSLYLDPERISNIAYRKGCGRSDRTIFAAWIGKEIRIAAGCFFDTLDAFERAVDVKYTGKAADDYKQAARECVDDLTEKPGKHHDR
ncbi:hypothetical protein [Serratia symbiotica]|uniref:Uncharacterized protein n=1 Tax=Serratia symbiotica SCt-VLC TaxID=1347341 RepID=A0A068RFJ0_9GAMM|nr:hypothetical protein [Serratia symbiotica]CDG48965.1 hypothetical protein SCTVLC_2322 [Serratia symbiotica SCt-VLC]